MNHHARSYSEQPQVAPVAIGSNQHQSFIRVHSDSQQSLDQLFNPTHQPSVPLRNRNLPQSFFNPATKPASEATNGTNGINGTTTNNANGNSSQDVHMSNGNNLHMRSISFDPHHQPVASNRLSSTNQRLNLHTRTHSTIAPMPRLLSSHSSQEFLNGSPMQQDPSSNNASANNVSSPTHNNNISLSLQSYHNHHHNHNLHQNHHHHHNHSHHHSNSNNTHHPLSNGWSSTGNSMDDLPSSPHWSTAAAAPQQTVPNASVPGQPNLQQQLQVGPLATQPVLPEPALVQQATHQQAFYSAQSIPAAAAPADNVHVAPTNNFHSRSVSFNQRPDSNQMINSGFHMRTHSTLAPMSSGACNLHPAAATVASHQSSHQSSQDFLNHSSATNASGGSTGWSSSGYSTDDMTNGHCWNAGGAPMAAGPPMATDAQGQTTLHHTHHHHQQQHVQPVVTQAQGPQSQQVFYQV